MTDPILDKRDKQELSGVISRRIAEYTPEWRYRPGEDDPGAAIVSVFTDMFTQTLDRYNRLPSKYYVEFLNILGVSRPGATAASGYVRFETSGAPDVPVTVPSETEVFVRDEDGSNIVFGTTHKIEATGAALTDLFYADTASGHLERLSVSGENTFFAPNGGTNLQHHCFAISQNEVLSVQGNAEIRIELICSARFTENETAKKLADPEFAVWYRITDGVEIPFERVRAENGVIVLTKEDDGRIDTDENGRLCVNCRILPGGRGDITLSGVNLQSKPQRPQPADSLAHNNVPLKPEDGGGYCFGRRPAEYELFYMRSDDIFSKRGARVDVSVDLSIVTYSTVDTSPQYEFNRRIIDKTSAVKVVPDDVFVEQVVWEYHNGIGWTELPVRGDVNMFGGKGGLGDAAAKLTFVVPRDIKTSVVNSEEGMFIRARVVHVANFLSTMPNYLLPFVKGVELTYDYTGFVPVDFVRAEGNAEVDEITDASRYSELNATVFRAPLPHPKAMYLAFDHSPHAMPLSLMLDIAGNAAPDGKILFEAYNGTRFERIRAVDDTQNLRHSGTILLYISQPVERTSLFGKQAHWLRMSLSSSPATDAPMPRVRAIHTNVVSALGRQRAEDRYFSTEIYAAGKTIELLDGPILDCRVRVDEAGEISDAEIERLRRRSPELIETEYDGNELRRCFVTWQRVPSLLSAQPDARVYEVDPIERTIKFGDGHNGKIPPRGDLNIRVSYDYGGGVRGNVDAGSVRALVGSIARITGVTNITPMRGGTDAPPHSKTEQLGNRRFRHRYSAISASDYEEIVAEQFERVSHVKCFTGTNEDGEAAPGHICIAIAERESSGDAVAAALCDEIFRYLSQRCGCNLLESGRLHVVPTAEVTISVEVDVVLRDLNSAAVTQQQISDSIDALLTNLRSTREIGDALDLSEIYRVVQSNPNVSEIIRILPEGRYARHGREYLIAPEGGKAPPFATLLSGTHTVRIR